MQLLTHVVYNVQHICVFYSVIVIKPLNATFCGAVSSYRCEASRVIHLLLLKHDNNVLSQLCLDIGCIQTAGGD